MNVNLQRLSMFKTSREVKTDYSYDTFRHPKLLKEELRLGCKLGLDRWVDTCCIGRHAHVEKFVLGKTVTVTGFSSSLRKLDNLPFAHILYTYDHAEGSVILIEHNNTIYMGENMDDSLSNLIQSEEVGVGVDLRPKYYYKDEEYAQTITFPDGIIIRILYDGSLPFISVRRPTPNEIENCRRLQRTSRDDWNPYHLKFRWSGMIANAASDGSTMYTDPISFELMSSRLMERASFHQILYEKQIGAERPHDQMVFTTLSRVSLRESNSLSPEQLSRM